MAIKGSRYEFEDDLARLQAYDASSQRVKQIRARCLEALESRHRKGSDRASLFAVWRHRLEPVAAVVLCAIYLAAAVTSSLALYR